MYIYDAALYCDDCADSIMEELDYAGRDTRFDGDSDNYPQYCSGPDESDCPEHCDGCGEFLGNALTSDGVDYVVNSVREDLEAGMFDSVACTVWRDYYYWLDFPAYGACERCGKEAILEDDDDYVACCADCLAGLDCDNCDGSEGCSGRCYDLPFTD